MKKKSNISQKIKERYRKQQERDYQSTENQMELINNNLTEQSEDTNETIAMQQPQKST
jgi:hypothetical protein